MSRFRLFIALVCVLGLCLLALPLFLMEAVVGECRPVFLRCLDVLEEFGGAE